MEPTTVSGQETRQRTLYFLANPEQWPHWPFLPLVRRTTGEEELGLLYDALHAKSIAGFRCTVFFCNLFLLPSSVEELLVLKRETFDTFEDIANAGWTVD